MGPLMLVSAVVLSLAAAVGAGLLLMTILLRALSKLR